MQADLAEDDDWEHLDMSPNEEIPRQASGYFTYLKEAALEAYIDYNLDQEDNCGLTPQ